MLVCKSSKFTSGRKGAAGVSASLPNTSSLFCLSAPCWEGWATEDCRERGAVLRPNEVDRLERAASEVFDLSKTGG